MYFENYSISCFVFPEQKMGIVMYIKMYIKKNQVEIRVKKKITNQCPSYATCSKMTSIL